MGRTKLHFSPIPPSKLPNSVTMFRFDFQYRLQRYCTRGMTASSQVGNAPLRELERSLPTFLAFLAFK
jgi:hypothetical protein